MSAVASRLSARHQPNCFLNHSRRELLEPSFATCPIFISVFFDESNEPPNQSSHIRLTKPLAVSVDDAAMSQTRSQTSLDIFRDRIDIAADERPALTIKRFEQRGVVQPAPRCVVNGNRIQCREPPTERPGCFPGNVFVQQQPHSFSRSGERALRASKSRWAWSARLAAISSG